MSGRLAVGSAELGKLARMKMITAIIRPERLEVSSPGRGADNDPVTWAPVVLRLP